MSGTVVHLRDYSNHQDLLLLKETTGAVVKSRASGRRVPGLCLDRVAICCGLEPVTFQQLLR